MSRSIFGWDLPPGCTHVPGDEPAWCEVCGQSIDRDECVCPECWTCGEVGDPKCYEDHGMIRTQEQIDALERAEEALRQEAEAEESIFKDMEKFHDGDL